MKYINFLFATLLALSFISCSNNDSITDPLPEVTMADFSGSWIATSAIYTNKSNTSETLDFISVGGHIRYTGFSDGRMRTWVDFMETPIDEWDAQAVLMDGDKLVFTPAEDSRDPYTLTYEIEENRITFTNSDDKFDFTLSGGEKVPATTVFVFVPN